MTKNSIVSNRILWMDIMRGILILSVVVGHSTGKFNGYIYQFHMGAFFLVSGYMSRPEKRSVLQTAFHRLMTTYLPVFTATVFLGSVMALMNYFDCYSLIMLDEQSYIGFLPILREFFTTGNLYVWWLGAGWFALILFKSSVLNRLILAIDGDSYSWKYGLMSVLLLLYGYCQVESGGRHALILIAYFYFSLGTIFRRIFKPDINIHVLKNVIGMAITGFLLWLNKNHYGFTVDYPSYHFNNPAIDVTMSVNGFLFCFFAAQLLGKVPYISKSLAVLGQNTFPIMLFHFMWFKPVYWLLYQLEIVPQEYIRNFTPTDEIGQAYWWLFAAVSVGLSILFWKGITAVKPMRVLWGQEKKAYDQLWNVFVEKTSKVTKSSLFMRMQKTLRSFTSIGLLSFICCIITTVALLSVYYSTHHVGSTLEDCVIEAGIYEDSWCEDYVKVKIRTGKNGSVEMQGWTSVSLTGGEEISVYCDGVEVVRYSVNDALIAFSIPAKPNAEVSLEIYSNFNFQADPPDIRCLSFIINSLNAY